MKKIIAIFVVMLAFGLNANAQQKTAPKTLKPATNKVDTAAQAAITEAALKDVTTLSGYVKLTADQKVTFKNMFEEIHRMRNQNLSSERKTVANQSFEAKLKSSLEPQQLAKIEGNEQLIKSLTSI